jgi:hypothetical protein
MWLNNCIIVFHGFFLNITTQKFLFIFFLTLPFNMVYFENLALDCFLFSLY